MIGARDFAGRSLFYEGHWCSSSAMEIEGSRPATHYWQGADLLSFIFVGDGV